MTQNATKDSRTLSFRPNRIIFLSALATFLFLTHSAPSIAAATKKKTLEIMSYNVENLFDLQHDSEKEDWTFLPKDFPGKKKACAKVPQFFYRKQCFTTDWTQEKLTLKLAQIKKLILSERGQLPDVLTLIEVENENVVKMLAQTLGFKHYVVTNSPDERGIDVALLYNESPYFKAIAHREFNLFEQKVLTNKTRNILEVVFQVKEEESLSIFVNHWPSQGNPNSDRMAIAKFLAGEIAKRGEINGRHVISVGDYNTITSNNPNPIQTYLTGRGKSEALLTDLHDEFMENVPGADSLMAKGTHFYTKEHSWSFLDKILVSPGLVNGKANIAVNLKSFAVYHPQFATISEDEAAVGTATIKDATTGQDHGAPQRYDFDTLDAKKAGFSDHFALQVTLTL